MNVENKYIYETENIVKRKGIIVNRFAICMSVGMKKVELTELYYCNNAKKIHYMVDKILRQFGGITDCDYDDFYSLANEVFVCILKKYDEEKDFESYLYSCLSNRIKSEITNRNRIKRRLDRISVSMDALIEMGEISEDTMDLGFSIEQELDKKGGMFMEEEIEHYLEGLSDVQKRILDLKIQNFKKAEIMRILQISGRTYDENFEQMRSFDKVNILIRKEKTKKEQSKEKQKRREFSEKEIYQNIVRDREGKEVIYMENKLEYGNKNDKDESKMGIWTSEVSKCTSYSVSSYIKKLKNYSIRGNHPLQRNSNQWNNLQKQNLITTVLNKYPIPEVILAEQTNNLGTVNWLIDGKQRLTNLLDYKEGRFKVGKSAERPVIKYQITIKDEKGNVLLDESGAPRYEVREFDVRGKYYSDLPEELRERFDEYSISAVQFLSCSDDDIEYHIRRYNAAKPMSAAQKGITHLGEKYAEIVKRITSHVFFKNIGSFKVSEFSNGTIDRVVTESIMAIYFLGDWKKKQEDICTYLKENAKESHFENFRILLDRLTKVVNREVTKMFNSKDAFLWFGLFERFTKLNLKDELFIEFMVEFKNHLHEKEIENKSYDDFCNKGTKDKITVIEKLTIMEKLMKEQLKIMKQSA